MDLSSFGENATAAVFGASGGIGNAFVEALEASENFGRIFAFARTPNKLPSHWHKTTYHAFEMEDEASLKAAAELCFEPLHLVLVATGLLHDSEGLQPEKSCKALSYEGMARAFAINAAGPAIIAKHMIPKLSRDRKSTFAALSARVGSISDNHLGGWYAYRASKAALNQFIKCHAIELARKNKHALCVGLHPGTVDTNLSAPFQSNVRQGKLFTPEFSAHSMLSVLNGLGVSDTGCLIAWDGVKIEP